MKNMYFIAILALCAGCLIENSLSKRVIVTENYVDCAIMDIAGSIDVPYQNSLDKTVLASIPIEPTSMNQNGTCGNLDSKNVTHLNINTESGTIIRFDFSLNTSQVFLTRIEVEYDTRKAPFINAQTKSVFTSTATMYIFLSSETNYYHCTSDQTYSFPDKVSVTLRNINVQAFDVKGSDLSGQKDVCSADKATNTTTTLAPSTTRVTANTTVAPNKTTTIAPAANTTLAPNTTTTILPNITSTMMTTAMPSPTPNPEPTFSVKDPKTGNVCLLVRLNATFSITYETATRIFRTDKAHFTPSGTCSVSSDMITLSWVPVPGAKPWDLTLTFNTSAAAIKSYAVGDSTKDFALSLIQLKYIVENATFPDSKVATAQTFNVQSSMDSNRFKAPMGTSYKCDATAKEDMGKNVTLDVSQVRYEAFRNSNSTDFAKESVCSADTKPSPDNLVPIIVGCLLAGLVIVVIIAYIIGRRRQRSGYDNI